jgi:cytochrome c
MKVGLLVATLVVSFTGMAVFRTTLNAQTTKSVWDGVYTEEQAKRGEAVYRQFCTACHGAALTGGEAAGPLTGAQFTANWNGVTVGDLFERIKISMPLDRPGVLTRQQNADVLAFVLSANKFPVGTAELARQTEYLRQIKFEVTKPGTSGS